MRARGGVQDAEKWWGVPVVGQVEGIMCSHQAFGIPDDQVCAAHQVCPCREQVAPDFRVGPRSCGHEGH